MANEFIARNGLISQNNSTITGSLTVTGGITGSLFGTSSYSPTSSYSLTSSYSSNITGTPNYVSKFTGTNTLGNSSVYDDGTNVGIGISAPTAKLHIVGTLSNGDITTATGDFSHAEGSNTVALGSFSHTEGESASTGTGFAFHTISISGGVLSIPDYGNLTPIIGVGNLLLFDDSAYDNTYGRTSFRIASASFDGTKTYIILADSTVATSEVVFGDLAYYDSWAIYGGTYPIYGLYSHAEGYNGLTLGPHSHAEGKSSKVYGDFSHAEGEGTATYGLHSHAEGSQTKAEGLSSHAEGLLTIASGDYSHTEGSSTSTKAFGYFSNSIVSGVISLDSSYGDVKAYMDNNYITLYDKDFDNIYGTKTFKVLSVSSAVPTIVSLVDTSVNTTAAYIGVSSMYQPTLANRVIPGPKAHTEGEDTSATGLAAHAEGLSTTAVGDYSHTEGYKTVTVKNYQHASGMWNAPVEGEGAFMIGNGDSVGNRSNILVASGSQVSIYGGLDAISITGSLLGTATSALTASFVNSLRQVVQITGSLNVTGSTVLTGSVRGQVSALTIAGSTASLDLSTNNFFTLTLPYVGVTHISASNIQPGQTVNLRLNSLGNTAVSFNSVIKQASGSFYSGSSGIIEDIVTFISFDSSTLYMSALRNLI